MQTFFAIGLIIVPLRWKIVQLDRRIVPTLIASKEDD